MERLHRILRIVIFCLVSLILGTVAVVHLPAVQDAVSRKASSILENALDADVRMNHLHYNGFGNIVIDGLTLIDPSPFENGGMRGPDTLLYAGTISTRIYIPSLLRKENVVIRDLTLKNVRLDMVLENNIFHNNLKRMLRKPYSPDGKPFPEKKIFTIKKFTVRHFDYSLRNLKEPHKAPGEGKIDWKDIQVYDLCLDADHFDLDHGIFGANLNKSSFREKSGIEVKNLSARADVGRGNVRVTRINLNDGLSQLNLDLNLAGRKRAYQHFIEDVVITADISSACVDTKTISYFAKSFKAIPDCKLNLRGKYYGSVAKMMFDNMNVNVDKSSIATTISGGIYGLPELDNLQINLKLAQTTFYTSELDRLLRKMGRAPKTDISNFGKGNRFCSNIYANGSSKNMNIILDLEQGSRKGGLKANLQACNALSRGKAAIGVHGRLSAGNLDLGSLLGKDQFGRISMSCDIDAVLPFKDSPLDARLSNTDIKKLGFKNKEFKNIHGSAAIQGEDITAEITVNDAAIQGDIALWSSKYEYNASAAVRMLDLRRMGFDKRETSIAGFNIYGHLDKDLKNLKGNAVISDIYLYNGSETQRLGDITLNADNTDGWYNLGLDADFATASFVGNRKDLRFSLNTFDTRGLLAFAYPGGYIESGTSVNATIDGNGSISGSILSGRIAKGKNNVKNLQADFSGTTDQIYAAIIADEITAGSFILKNNTLAAIIKDKKSLTFDYSFDDSAEKNSSADIHGQANIDSKKNISIEIRPSKLMVGGQIWNIPLFRMARKDGDIRIDGMNLTCEDKHIFANGIISQTHTDKLELDIENLDMSRLSAIAKPVAGKISGILNISGTLFSPYIRKDLPTLDLSISADSVCLSNREIGDIRGVCRRIPGQDVMTVSLVDSVGGRTPMLLDATMNPVQKQIEGRLTLADFALGAVQPLFSALLDDISGNLSGDIRFYKDNGGTDIKSNGINFDGCKMTLALTGVTYDLDGKLGLNSHGISLNRITMKDRFGNIGRFKGGIKWNRLRDIKTDLHVDMPKMEILNKASSSSKFYGNAFIGASADIKGPFNDMEVDLTLRTLDNSVIHTRLSNSLSAAKQELLTFINPFEDNLPDLYTEQIGKTLKRKEGNRLQLKARAIINPELQLYANISTRGINSDVYAQGKGDISISYDSSSKDLDLKGDYTMSDGTFTVDAGTIVKRSFNIKNGSAITFGGDLRQSLVNIEAQYQTKASIGALISDTTSVSNRRLVNCGIQIKNRISDPNVNLSIDIPDLDPSVKAKVESALSTEDKIQKQFLSLLISNNFLPDDQGGVVNNNSLLYSNVSEIMSNQINNIFTKLNIPLDLGFHYQHTQTGNNMFDVALNTQLWNNRIIIGGTVGNRKNMSTANESIFGDLDIQLKVIPSGTLRLKAFSHSADQYTNYLDNSQRNGLGITWQQEFNNFNAWIRRLFSNKAVKAAIDEKEAMQAKKQKTITIDE